MAGKKRYTKPAELVTAVQGWARELLPPYYSSPQAIAFIKAAASGIAGTDRKLEARAKKIHTEALRALGEVVKFAEQNPRANTGYAHIVRILSHTLAPRGFDSLRAANHHLGQQRPANAKPQRGWTRLTHLVCEIGNPWPAYDSKAKTWRFGGPGGRWRFGAKHELTLDELVAFAVLAGLFTKVDATRAIGQARRFNLKTPGASVADGVDVLRKAVVQKLKSLTRDDHA